jgi:hypothetical protein
MEYSGASYAMRSVRVMENSMSWRAGVSSVGMLFGLVLSWAAHAEESLAQTVERYKARFPLADPYSKQVANNGTGDSALQGVRNFRVVLQGVVYRGGANNRWRRPPRDNQNPLPPEGLENLCKEGFSDAVYLYRKNYVRTAVSCEAIATRTPNTIDYHQRSPLASRSDNDIKAILEEVHKRIRGEERKPLYLHCWNGWHASGFASALVLRQFCGVSGDDAAAYWTRNTDDVDVPSANAIRKRIRDFTPIAEMTVPHETQKLICPTM